jgi:LppP/LprE lipoprotein
MGGMASTARGSHAARRPGRRPPRRTRWPRRIGGMIATAGLLGVAVLMYTMVAPSPDATDRALLGGGPAAAPAQAKAKKKGAKARAKAKQAKKPAKLTAKQLAARASAVTLLRNQGYLPTREADYNPRHELRVLVGYRNGDPLGPRRAFFFVGTRFIGHDSSGGSTKLAVTKSGNRWVTLRYGVFAPGAEVCCPSSTSKVRFNWTGSALAPAGAIPLGRIATG